MTIYKDSNASGIKEHYDSSQMKGDALSFIT
jgi:hypothetical protein